jgi:chromosome segregation ATPase
VLPALCGVAIAAASGIGIASIVLAQQRQPATPDDLLAEVRLLRGDLNHGIRAQVTTARLTLHEGRLAAWLQQMASVRQQLSESQLRLAPYTLQLKQAQETNSEILAPLRSLIEQVQKRDHELLTLETELDRRITSEEQHLSDLHARLDEIERSLATPGR